MEEYVNNKEQKIAIYQNKTESFVVERTSNQGTESYCFSSLKTVKSKQIINSVDRHIMNDSSCMDVSTSFRNISSYIRSNKPEITFKSNQQESIRPVVPKTDFTEKPNKAVSPNIGFKIMPIKPVPILDLRKKRVEVINPVLDLRKKRDEINIPVLNLREEPNETEFEIMDLSKKEVKTVESDLDLSKHSAKEECKNLDLTKKRVEVIKTTLSLTKNPSKVNHRNLDLAKKRSEITKSGFDLRKGSIDFLVPPLYIDETDIDETTPLYIDEPIPKEKIVNLNSQSTETKAGERSYEGDDFPELDYYPETPLDIPIPTIQIDERVNPSSKEKINVDLNSQGAETKDIEGSYDVDYMPVLDYYPETQLDCPVPTFHIDEGVNPISKEIIVDRNYQDLEVKDRDGSFEVEASLELDNFQEAPFDFSMPKLHFGEIISPSSKEKTVYHNSHDNEIKDEEGSYEVEALPEFDITEPPMDFHVPSHYIEETLNRTAKEKIVDFNSQGIEVKGGLGSYEVLPELDITEAPINFHIPRYHIEETLNRTAKEKIVDLNSQGIEVKGGLGSYEVLPEYDITEVPVDFPVPRLHSDEKVNSLTKEKKDSLKSEGIVIKNSVWSDEEEALLRRNYMDFLKQYRIHDSRVLLRRSFLTHPQRIKFLKAKHFYVRLGKDINERTLRSIYQQARRMFL